MAGFEKEKQHFPLQKIEDVVNLFKDQLEILLQLVHKRIPGGTAVDYSDHAVRAIEHLARIYASYQDKEYIDVHKQMILTIFPAP